MIYYIYIYYRERESVQRMETEAPVKLNGTAHHLKSYLLSNDGPAVSGCPAGPASWKIRPLHPTCHEHLPG